MKAYDYVTVMRRRLAWVIISSLVGVALGGGAAALTHDQYRATAQIFVANGVAPVKDNVGPVLAASQYALDRTPSWAALGTSTRVLQAAVDSLQLKTSPYDLVNQATVTAVAKTVVIEVAAKDVSASSAVSVANAVANALVKEIQRVETTPTAKAPIVEAFVSRPAASQTTTVSSTRLFLPLLGLLVGLGLGLCVAGFVEALRKPTPRRRVDVASDTKASAYAPLAQHLAPSEERFPEPARFRGP